MVSALGVSGNVSITNCTNALVGDGIAAAGAADFATVAFLALAGAFTLAAVLVVLDLDVVCHDSASLLVVVIDNSHSRDYQSLRIICLSVDRRIY